MALKKFKIILNDKNNLCDYLNGLYEESNMLILTLQNEINKIINSTDLSELDIEEKEKYAKSINAFLTNKLNALKLKGDISKILTEVLKFGGNENGALSNIGKVDSNYKIESFNIKDLQTAIDQVKKEEDVKIYQIKS